GEPGRPRAPAGAGRARGPAAPGSRRAGRTGCLPRGGRSLPTRRGDRAGAGPAGAGASSGRARRLALGGGRFRMLRRLAGGGRCLDTRAVARLGLEAVADPEVGVDVAPPRRCRLELLAQLAYEDVDRAV